MYIIRRYVTVGFLVASISTLAVLTLIMCIGITFRATNLIARGVPWFPIFKMTLYGIPDTFAYTMPLSVLVASLLVFGRLSTDGEIMAMKACGISIWQVVTGPIIVSVFFSVLCLQINAVTAPENHYAQRSLMSALRVESPTELLEEGRFIRDFDGLTMYIGRKKDKQLTNVRIYDMRQEGVKREIRAKSGMVRTSETGVDLILDLFDVRVSPPPFSDDEKGAVFLDKWPIVVPDVMSARKYRKGEKDMTVGELAAGIRWIGNKYPNLDAFDLTKQKMSLLVEMNRRFALSFSCFAFALLGIPLGTSTSRKRSSVGIGISLLFAFLFYLFIIVAKSLSKYPALNPDLMTWIPVIISLIAGFFLIKKLD